MQTNLPLKQRYYVHLQNMNPELFSIYLLMQADKHKKAAKALFKAEGEDLNKAYRDANRDHKS